MAPARTVKKLLILGILMLLLLAGGGGAAWWFLLREPPEEDAVAEAVEVGDAGALPGAHQPASIQPAASATSSTVPSAMR